MGIAGLMTINSGRLLETCRIETACPPLLVTTTVVTELSVFTVTDPKLSEAGLTPTPAWIGVDKNNELTKNNPRDRHTSRVLCMRGNPSCSIQVREQNGAEGTSFANRDSYFQREDTTGGKFRFGTGVLRFSDGRALLRKEYGVLKLPVDKLLNEKAKLSEKTLPKVRIELNKVVNSDVCRSLQPQPCWPAALSFKNGSGREV